MSDPNFLDLDALEPPVERGLKLGGVSHTIKPISVEDWLANLKDVRELQAFMQSEGEPHPDEIARRNLEMTARSLHRSFPTIPFETFMTMELRKLDAIVKFVRATDGTDKVEAAMKAEADPANPPLPSPTTA